MSVYGMMSSRALILLYLTVLSSVIGYKLPHPDQSFSSGPQTTGEYSSSPLVWEWETQNKADKTLLTLIRMVREISDKKTTASQPVVKYPSKAEKVSKSPLEKSPVSPQIVLPSKVPYTKPQVMAQHSEDETTSLDELDHTLTEEKAKTIQTDESPAVATKIIATQMKFSTQEQLSTPGPTQSKDVSVFKKSTTNEATTFGPIHSTTDKLLSSIPDSTTNTVVEETTAKHLSSIPNSTTNTVVEEPTAKHLSSIPNSTTNTVVEETTAKHLSSIPNSTTNTVVEETTSIIPSKIPNNTPSKPILTSDEPTTHGETTAWIRDSKGSSSTPVPVTHISTTSDDKIFSHSLMKQCMLAILILAILCTIFIITTIALAAKLTTMRQKQKLRHPATYTEMRCISSLLPESDQQSKAKPKRLKTFAAMEESDGDNTTLNSFLPDH